MTHTLRLIHADETSELITWQERLHGVLTYQGRCYRLYGLIGGYLTYEEETDV